MDVLIYARLSQQDPDARPGEATATQRQIADCRAHAADKGWPVVGIYEDPDSSASSLRRKRPDFERMLADLGDGVQVGAVVTYKLDRLLRHPLEAERIIQLADQRDFGIISLNDPGIDLSTPTGRAMFRMTITWAKLETETMSLRIRRKAREIAETGHPNGGGIRCFGLTPDKSRIVPGEATLISEAARRIIAGDSMHSIALDWNALGIRTPGRRTAPEGRAWEVSSLKRMLIAPRIVGDRSHHGAVVGTGVIPALLDRATWDQLRALLNARTGSAGDSRVRKHLLTGVAVCGRCGAKLVARPDQHRIPRYCCMKPRGCGRLVIAAHNLEPLVAEAIAIRLDSPAFRSTVDERRRGSRPAVDLDQLRADEASLEEAARAYFVERAVTKAEYVAVREDLERRIDVARRRLESTSASAGLGRIAGVNVRAEWSVRSVPWRHEVARMVIDRVVIAPAPRRGTRFDPARVDIEWRV
jgi:DNA invertase Pin-like site-specific DNA recombinase